MHFLRRENLYFKANNISQPHACPPAGAGGTFANTPDLLPAGPFFRKKLPANAFIWHLPGVFYEHAVCGMSGMLWGFHFTFLCILILCILNLCLQIETCRDHNSCEACHNDRQYQRQDKVVYVSLSVGQLGCRQHSDDTCTVRQCIQTDGRHCNQSV